MIITIVDTIDIVYRIGMRAYSLIAPMSVVTTRLGFKMHCDIRDFIQRRIRFFGLYEPNLTYYIASRIKPGDHFVDVGANVGYITLVASTLVGKEGGVISIEASPDTYSALARNLQLNDATNVRAVNMAATNGPCEVQIIAGEKRNSGSNSIGPVASTTRVCVRGQRLSRIVEEKACVTFIKIDVEGSEGPILADIVDHLDEFENLQSIAVELTERSKPMIARLIAAGFSCFGLPNNYRIGYLLVRRYLDRSREGDFISKTPLQSYSPEFTDYVFERALRSYDENLSVRTLQAPEISMMPMRA